MSDPRTESTEHRPVEAASGAAHGRHRGPASDDAAPPAAASGRGRHRRPPAQDPVTN